MYIEASGRQPGDKAWLLSPPSGSSPTTMCVEFWYNMYGAQTGTLNVYLKRNGANGTPVFTKSGK